MAISRPPHPLFESFVQTIQSMQIFVTTFHTLSKTYYSGESTLPFQGIIQGNGASSPAWMLTATMIILYLHQKN